MKILVTGAAGFIGSCMAAHLKAQGATVFVDVAHEDTGTTRRWPLTEAGLLHVMRGEVPDAVVHAAGSGTVAKVAAHPALELPANLGAWLAVLQYARAHAARSRIILLSSAALYGDAPPTPQRECDARAPVSLYGVAKSQAEQLGAYYAGHSGLQVTAVRLFSVYGNGLRKQLLWDAMNKLMVGDSVFFGTGQERRDWVHIDDVCRFMSRLLTQVGQIARADLEVFNCAGSPASTFEILAVLAKAAQAPEPRFSGTTRVGDPRSLIADCSKAHAALDWRASVRWQDGAADYAQWFLSLKR